MLECGNSYNKETTMIFDVLVLGDFSENCYIIGSEKNLEGMIIDPGDDAGSILETVNRLKLKTSIIVLTHAHGDHIGALKEVKEATGATVAIHEADVPLLKQSTGRLMGYSFPTPPAPDRLLHDKDTINVGDLSFSVIHTPGHTSGGICLYGEGVLFSGDTLFNSGIGRTDFPGGSFQAIIKSIRDHLLTLPDGTVVYPGHGLDTTIGDEKENNPFLNR